MTRIPGERGFTLIEVLVVLVLIGIITALAVARIGMQDDRAEQAAQRLAGVLEIASRRAVIEARELGLVFDSEGYRFVALGDDGWQSDELNDQALGSRSLDSDLRLEIEREELPGSRRPGEDTGDTDDGSDTEPQVLILSSGEITPFRAVIQPRDSDASTWTVSATFDGRIRSEPAEGSP